MARSTTRSRRYDGTIAIAIGACVAMAIGNVADASTVINTADSGGGSLRQAILDANADAGPDLIDFAIPGAGPHTIAVLSSLPTLIDNATTIDGYTQAGSSANTNPFGQACNADIRVVIDGAGAGAGADGITIAADNITVSGLSIINFDDAGVRISNGDQNQIFGCFIGLEPDGTTAAGNGDGVRIRAGSSNNLIGTNGDGFLDETARNVISANDEFGIIIVDAGTAFNVVAGNYVGTDCTGTLDRGNGNDGVTVRDFATLSRIGLQTTNEERNLVSGNDDEGIELRDTAFNVVAGNRVGTNAAGTASLGNESDGIELRRAGTNTIGSNSDGLNDAAEGNLVSGNGTEGIEIQDNSDFNLVAANFVGTNLAGTADLGNGCDGVLIVDDSNGNLVGATSAPEQGNLISGNGFNGVAIMDAMPPAGATSARATPGLADTVDEDLPKGRAEGSMEVAHGLPGGVAATTPNFLSPDFVGLHPDYAGQHAPVFQIGPADNTLNFNFIGTDVTGTACIGNDENGVLIFNRPNNVVAGCLVSCNGSDGIDIEESGSDFNLVTSCFIGTDVTGTQDLGNDDDGVEIETGADDNVVQFTLSSGNGDSGIEFCDGGTNRNIAFLCFLGTDVNGTAPLGNDLDGVTVENGPEDSVILACLCSGNGCDGVDVLGDGTDRTLIVSNSIGTDISGTVAIGNADEGVCIEDGPEDTVVGTNGDGAGDAGEGNLISGNGSRGVLVEDCDGTRISGNMIGTDVTGTAAIPNGNDGIELENSDDNCVGTDGDGVSDDLERNVISGNGDEGIELDRSDNNKISGNLIGTDINCAQPLPNDDDGICVDNSDNNCIGSDGDGVNDAAEANVIAFNGDEGVDIFEDSEGNHLLMNSIYENDSLGIDLDGGVEDAFGVTENDQGDPDVGSNNFQNFPVLVCVDANGNAEFTLNSLPNEDFRVEFFASALPDLSLHGEGEEFLDFVEVTTNGSGDVTINTVLATFDPDVRPWVSATATLLEAGAPCLPVETSEFSEVDEDCDQDGVPDCVQTTPEGDPAVSVFTDECQDAQFVCPCCDTYFGNTAGATQSIAFRDIFGCGLLFGVNDVFARYRPAWNGLCFIRVEGPRPRFVYSVHTGCPTTLENQVNCNDTDHFEIVFDAEAGQDYWIRIAPIEFGVGGPFELDIVGPDCCLNVDDCNGNTIPDVCECPEDITGVGGVPDGVVDNLDLAAVLAAVGQPCAGCPEDVDGSGAVDATDIQLVLIVITFEGGLCPVVP